MITPYRIRRNTLRGRQPVFDKLAVVMVCILLGLILAGVMAILVRLGIAGAVPKHASDLHSALFSTLQALNLPAWLAGL